MMPPDEHTKSPKKSEVGKYGYFALIQNGRRISTKSHILVDKNAI